MYSEFQGFSCFTIVLILKLDHVQLRTLNSEKRITVLNVCKASLSCDLRPLADQRTALLTQSLPQSPPRTSPQHQRRRGTFSFHNGRFLSFWSAEQRMARLHNAARRSSRTPYRRHVARIDAVSSQPRQGVGISNPNGNRGYVRIYFFICPH